MLQVLPFERRLPGQALANDFLLFMGETYDIDVLPIGSVGTFTRRLATCAKVKERYLTQFCVPPIRCTASTEMLHALGENEQLYTIWEPSV